jgi:quercetin dioxygenase-like cupin family protein
MPFRAVAITRFGNSEEEVVKRKVLLMSLLLVGACTAAFAFAVMFTYQGTVDSFDFGEFGPGHPVPGTIEIQAFNLRPGEVVPWHFHKGTSYVMVVRGHLIEQDLTPEGGCGGVGALEAGQAFVEPAGRVHQVMNPGPGAVTIYWATIFPQGGTDLNFVENGPTCNF